jgi:hypothetical protein
VKSTAAVPSLVTVIAGYLATCQPGQWSSLSMY